MLAENTVQPTENGAPQQGQICTKDGLLPPSLRLAEQKTINN
jgi:hypothetical protein